MLVLVITTPEPLNKREWVTQCGRLRSIRNVQHTFKFFQRISCFIVRVGNKNNMKCASNYLISGRTDRRRWTYSASPTVIGSYYQYTFSLASAYVDSLPKVNHHFEDILQCLLAILCNQGLNININTEIRNVKLVWQTLRLYLKIWWIDWYCLATLY